MKLVFSFLMIALLGSAQAVTFECVGPQKTGIRGNLDQNNGKLEIASGSLDFRSKLFQFTRAKRRNEGQYKFAKFIGSDLFYNFDFSMPKSTLSGQSTNDFVGYIGWIREGVGGKEDIRLDCGLVDNNPVMTNLYKKYRNLFELDRLSASEKKMVTSVETPEDLPKAILEKLKTLGFTITIQDEVIHNGGELVVSFSNSDDFNYSFVVKEGKTTLGYVFSLVTCNPEECYGWDALYLDSKGNILFKSY